MSKDNFDDELRELGLLDDDFDLSDEKETNYSSVANESEDTYEPEIEKNEPLEDVEMDDEAYPTEVGGEYDEIGDDDLYASFEGDDDYPIQDSDYVKQDKGGGKTLLFIIIGVIVAVLLFLGVWFFARSSDDSDVSDPQTEQTLNGESLEEGAAGAETTQEQEMVITSLEPAINAHVEKNRLNREFAEATEMFASNYDVEAYQTRLNEINDTRYEVEESIPQGDDATELDNITWDSVREMYDYLVNAFSTDDPAEAVTNFNTWNELVQNHDSEYFDTLVNILDENDVPYEVVEDPETGDIRVNF